MITKEFLKSCTDEQINKGVAWLEAKRLGFGSPCEFISRKSNHPEKQYFILTASDDWDFTPCSNPNDAWPIILSNRIGVKPRGVDSLWYAYQGKIEVINENPLRAAMEVYILMSTQS